MAKISVHTQDQLFSCPMAPFLPFFLIFFSCCLCCRACLPAIVVIRVIYRPPPPPSCHAVHAINLVCSLHPGKDETLAQTWHALAISCRNPFDSAWHVLIELHASKAPEFQASTLM